MKKSILNTPGFRYIFEIIVIVFSVSLSFYIQDVLNDRGKIEQKNLSLKGVIDDLKKDNQNFQTAINLARIRIKNIDTLLNLNSPNSSDNVNIGVKRYFGFLGEDTNYNSMVSTGSLEYISNKKLFNLINKYYSSQYGIMKDMSEQDENNYNGIIDYINANYSTFLGNLKEVRGLQDLFNEVDSIYFNKFTQSSLIKMKSDNPFITRINHQKWTVRVNLNLFKRAIEFNSELQELIINEINN